MRIAAPGRTSLSKYSGFCIEIFEKVLQHLEYDLPYEYYPINKTYLDL